MCRVNIFMMSNNDTPRIAKKSARFDLALLELLIKSNRGSKAANAGP
jgi:hypothetical protein